MDVTETATLLARVEGWVWGSQGTRTCKKHPIVHDVAMSPGGGTILEGLQKVF